jgi:hypothetical protein
MKNLLSDYLYGDKNHENFMVFSLMFDHLLSNIKASVMNDIRLPVPLPRELITDALRAEIYNEES